jgi:CBS domain-containing protein
MLSVAEIMTREPYTLGPDNSLAEARQLMAEHHIRHIPVVSGEDSLIGLVSHRDLLAAADSTVLGDQREATATENYVAISSVITSPVQTVDEQAGLRGTAMQGSAGGHYHRLGFRGYRYQPDGATGGQRAG